MPSLLAFFLRVYRLPHVPLRGDESFTAIFSASPLPEPWDVIRNAEPDPPLYCFLLRGAMFLFVQTGFTSRYLSVLFGLLAIPLIYQLARSLITDKRMSAEVGMYLLETAERLPVLDASGARWPNDAIQLDPSI